MRVCSRCGRPDNHASACPNCGSSAFREIGNNSDETVPFSAYNQNRGVRSVTPKPIQQQQFNSANDKKITTIVLCIVLGVVLIISIIIGVVAATGSSKKLNSNLYNNDGYYDSYNDYDEYADYDDDEYDDYDFDYDNFDFDDFDYDDLDDVLGFIDSFM